MAPPNSSTILTIFYILYRPSIRTFRILLLSKFWFRTVQNVDASFLYSVPTLSLLCSFLFVLSHDFLRRVYVIVARFLVHFFHLQSDILSNPELLAESTAIDRS